jgi:hypothetical protein
MNVRVKTALGMSRVKHVYVRPFYAMSDSNFDVMKTR